MIRYDNLALREKERIPTAKVLKRTESRKVAVHPQPTEAEFDERALMQLQDDGCPWA